MTEISYGTKTRIELVLEMIGTLNEVLDIGCHDGYISERIKKRGNDVTGIEISKENARLCNERGIKCIEQDVEEKFPLRKNTFDVVFAGELMEHIFDTDKLLQEIKRVLRPDGYLVLTTPNIAALSRRLRLLLGINPLIDIGCGKAGHIRYFTINSLKELLKRNGYFIDTWRTNFISFYCLRLIRLGKLFPTLGYGLIVKAKVKHETNI